MSREDDDKKVGYKKPPESGQFKKGKSGNPKGRPKGSSKDHSLMELILLQLETETPVQDSDGNTHNIKKKELLAARVVNDAIKGKQYAVRQVFNLGGNPENIAFM